MEWLKEWVRNLVMLVIVASALELLLPMSSMKKYVRLALGLMLLLAIVRPAFDLLGQEVVVDVTLFAAEESARLPGLGEIMARAGEFRERSGQLALEQARARLESEAQQAALTVPGVGSAAVRLRLEEADGQPEIRAITVSISFAGQVGGVRPVDPVEPVGPRGPDRSAEQADSSAAAQTRLAAAVRAAVAQRLGLAADPDLIQITWADEPGR